MQDYEGQLERLKKALNVESDTALAQLLEISQGSVSGAKKRGQIPYAWFFQVAEKTDSSLDWLFRGVGPAENLDGKPVQRQTVNAAPSTCPRCLDLYERLVQAQERENALLKENSVLKVENQVLQARLSPSASDKEFLGNTA
jgi:hypothetical protein